MNYIKQLENFYSVQEVVNNTDAPYVLDFKEIEADPLRSKVSLENHVFIMTKYHNLLLMLAYHLPYMLKSQLVDMYIQEGKSSAYGYQRIKELEKNLFIGVEKYNGAEYIFLTYRSYNYLGIDRSKNPVERKPSESVLIRHFARVELYIKRSILSRERQQFSFYRYYNSYTLEESFEQPIYKDYDLFEIKDLQKFYFELGSYFGTKNTVGHFFASGNYGLKDLLEICPDPFAFDKLDQSDKYRFLVAFIEKMFGYFSRRCSVMFSVEKGRVALAVNIIVLPLTSVRTIETFVDEWERFLFVLQFIVPDFAFGFYFYSISSEEEENIKQVVDFLENDERLFFYRETVRFLNLDLSKRYRKIDNYESNKSKSRKS